jgi:tetratricopeptide (TPR) repeat protein
LGLLSLEAFVDVMQIMVEMPDPSYVLGGDPDVLKGVVAHERGVLHELAARRPVGPSATSTTSTTSTLSRYRGTVDTDKRRATALWKLRRFAEAVEPLEEAEQVAALIPGWEPISVGARCVRAGALLGLERWAEVADLTDYLVEVREWLYDPVYLQTGLHTRMVALKALGRWEEADAAAAALRESLPEEQTARTRKHLREALELQALVAQRVGNPGLGLPLIDEAVALAVETEDREPLSRVLRLRAELLYATGRNAEARETLQTVIDTFRNDPEEFATSAVAIARGRKLRMRVQPRRRKST